jgi:hypothetical protein
MPDEKNPNIINEIEKMINNIVEEILQKEKLAEEERCSVNLKSIADSSMEILQFDTSNPHLLSNTEFLQAWAMLRGKAEQTLRLIVVLLSLKEKYKISDFDFQLFLEGFDGKL